MMDRKTLCIIAVMLALTALPVLAQTDMSQTSMPFGPGMGGGMLGGGFGPGMMGGGGCPMIGGGAGFGMGPMGPQGHGEMALDQCLPMHLQQLNLTDDQRQKLLNIMTDYVKERINLASQIQIKEIDLHALLMADNVDMRKVETQVRDINRLQGDLQLAGIRAFVAGKNVLTPQQRQMLGQMMLGCVGACPMAGGACPMLGGQGFMGGAPGSGPMGPRAEMPPVSPSPGH